MNEELIDLSDTLLKIYQFNLEFLKENFPNIYTDINNLSHSIDNNTYKQRYSLEYIDGYFDILNLENNGFFYHTNSYEDADIRAQDVDFSQDSSLNLLRQNPFTRELLKNDTYYNVVPIVDFINKNADLDNIEFNRIYKFIFIGVGLGLHMHEIYKKINSLNTMIIEPDIEIFRLSLFIIDYRVFNEGNKKLFLSIGNDKYSRIRDFNVFYENHNYMNYNIKHHLFIEGYSYIKDEIIDFFSSNSVTYFPYKLILQNLHRTIGFMKQKDKFLKYSLLMEKQILKDKKVLIISAGPSVDNYLNFIKEHQDKFIIICVDVIVRKLEKNSIVPDIIVSIDPHDLCADYITTKNPKYLDNTSFIFLSQQSKKVLEYVKGKNYYFSQVSPLIEELGWLGTVSNVGSFSFKMALHLGALEIYLIGCDAAFHQETGSQYSNDVLDTPANKIENEPGGKNSITSQDVIEVKGNLRDIIKTNRQLITFKEQLDNIIYSFKDIEKYTAYNLSDGVYIEGLIPLTQEELTKNISKFQKVTKNMTKELSSVSIIIDNLDYKEDIKILNRIISKVKKYQKIKLSSKDHFLDEKLGLMIWILTQSKELSTGVFGNIFLHYTELADTYINFLLNIKQHNLHTKESIAKINTMWSDGVLVVMKDIKKAIK